MSERLPPLNALKAFEAAARHLSVRAAADELHVSPAAVSHQIKNLEAHLGGPLFHRANRALRLTAAGEAALPLLREGFGRLAAAVQEMRAAQAADAAPAVFNVCAPPSFAAKWLMPRLSRYAADHAGLDIRLSASPAMIGAADETGRPAVDVAIRFGDGEHPGARVDKLLAVSALPFCSPRLLDGEHPLRRPADLRHHLLLHDDTDYPERPDWRAWLAAAGVDGIDAAHGLRFNQASLALEAAAAGQGVALTLQPLAQGDVAAGRLVAPFDCRLRLSSAYYLVSAETTAEAPAVVDFRNWLLAEAAAESAA